MDKTIIGTICQENLQEFGVSSEKCETGMALYDDGILSDNLNDLLLVVASVDGSYRICKHLSGKKIFHNYSTIHFHPKSAIL